MCQYYNHCDLQLLKNVEHLMKASASGSFSFISCKAPILAVPKKGCVSRLTTPLGQFAFHMMLIYVNMI